MWVSRSFHRRSDLPLRLGNLDSLVLFGSLSQRPLNPVIQDPIDPPLKEIGFMQTGTQSQWERGSTERGAHFSLPFPLLSSAAV